MKKLILIIPLIISLSGYAQAEFENIKLTENATDNTSSKVVVQSTNNVLNTISKTDLQDAFYFSTASALPVTGITDKLYITRDDNKLYRFNGTVYSPIGSNITGLNTDNLPKWDGTKLIDSGFKVNSSGNVILPTNVNDVAIFLMKDDVPTGSMLFQAGGGSASFGGGLRMFGSNSALNAGGVSIGLASGALRKFSINDTGLSNGSDVFTVFSNGTTLVNTTTDNTQGKLQVNGNITASAATLSNQVPTFGQMTTADALKANLASPSFTGTPTAPTATAGTNTGQIATTAFVNGNFVTLTGASQTISSQKIFSETVTANGGVNFGNNYIFTSANTPSTNFSATAFARFGNRLTFINDAKAVSFNLDNITSLRTYTMPNLSGTLALKSDLLYTNQTITANKTVVVGDFVNNNHLILRVDTAAGNVTITLPTFTALQGYKVTVRKIDNSANSVLIQGVGGVNIDGASTLVVSGQYGKATVGADLVQYIIL